MNPPSPSRPWSTDPIHDEVAKMPEEKLMGERPFYPIDDPQHPAPRDGRIIQLEAKDRELHELRWSTHYSIHGLGGCWTDKEGFCTMSDLDFAFWRPISPLAANQGAGTCNCDSGEHPLLRPMGAHRIGCPAARKPSPAPASASGMPRCDEWIKRYGTISMATLARTLETELDETARERDDMRLAIKIGDESVRQLVTQLNRYGTHFRQCLGEGKCTCGLDAAITTPNYREAFEATQAQLTTLETQLAEAKKEAYGEGVTAGKLEALKYTPEERERYGQWNAAFEDYKDLREQLAAAQRGREEAEAALAQMADLRATNAVYKDALEEIRAAEPTNSFGLSDAMEIAAIALVPLPAIKLPKTV